MYVHCIINFYSMRYLDLLWNNCIKKCQELNTLYQLYISGLYSQNCQIVKYINNIKNHNPIVTLLPFTNISIEWYGPNILSDVK